MFDSVDGQEALCALDKHFDEIVCRRAQLPMLLKELAESQRYDEVRGRLARHLEVGTIESLGSHSGFDWLDNKR